MRFQNSAAYFATLTVAFFISFVTVIRLHAAPPGKSGAELTKPPVLDASYNGEFHFTPASPANANGIVRIIIAQFRSAADAQRACDQLTAGSFREADIALFGQSVFVQAPADKSGPAQKIEELLTQAGGQMSGNVGSTPGLFYLNLAVTAANPAVAARIHHEIDLWLGLPIEIRPPAPWLGELDPAVLRSCETYRKVQDIKEDVRKANERSHGLTPENPQPHSQEEIKAMVVERSDASQAAIERLFATHDPALDEAVLAHEIKRREAVKDPKGRSAWQAELQHLVTHVTRPAGDEAQHPGFSPLPPRNRINGKAELNSQTITLRDLSLGSPARDFPMIARWLAGRGCTNIRYGVQVTPFDSQR